jgi:hypothetical protein
MEMRKRDAPRRTSSFDDFIQQLGNDIYGWTQVGDDIDGEAAGDRFGFSVAMSADGKRVAIGADSNAGDGQNSGHVRVYDLNEDEGKWTQVGQDLDGEARWNFFGGSVAMSADGTRIAIGAAANDGNDGSRSGHVRIYGVNDEETLWTQVGQDIDGEAANDQSGSSVAMSAEGTRITIGAIYNKGVNGSRSGHVRVYDVNDEETLWTRVGQDIDGEAAGDYSGISVAMSADGKRVAIGAVYNKGVNGSRSGHVRVYDVNDEETLWTQVGQDIDGEAAGDQSGSSVAMSADGTRITIGAYGNKGVNGSNDYSGHVRFYDWNDEETLWTQVGQDIDGEAADDQSGWSVAMSADGTRIAIGAHLNDGNGSNSGHVRVYDVNDEDTLWTPVGQDIDGEGADDQSGRSVAMSADGKRVAIGARDNKGVNGSRSGHVRVYEVRGFLYPCVLHVFACVPKFCTNLNMSQSVQVKKLSVSHKVCQDYAVHARTTITYDGVMSTISDGDVGVSPSTSITGSYIMDGGQVVSDSNEFAALKRHLRRGSQ